MVPGRQNLLQRSWGTGAATMLSSAKAAARAPSRAALSQASRSINNQPASTIPVRRSAKTGARRPNSMALAPRLDRDLPGYAVGFMTTSDQWTREGGPGAYTLRDLEFMSGFAQMS